jgi:hypothetical protein
MTAVPGRKLCLSVPRRLVTDLLHFAERVPTVPIQRRLRLQAVAVARRQARVRLSWCALMTKAYALVAAERSELRRAFLSFPRPHLYQHHLSVASIAVGRVWRDEEAVLFAQFRAPDQMGLQDLEHALGRVKVEPIETIPSFQRALRLSRLPRPLRRAGWWLGLNWSGSKRAQYLGTFGVSVYAGLGAASFHPLSPMTVTLNYGVIDDQGMVDVRLIHDARVLSGAAVARALGEIEEALNGPIVDELKTGPRAGAA